MLGDKLKRIRLQNGMTLARLSADAGVSKSMLSRVERNEATPTITTLQKMADALGVDLALLCEDTSSGDVVVVRDGRTPAVADRDEERVGGGQRNGSKPLPVSVVRSGQRKKVVLPWGASYEMLTPDLQRRIEFIFICYPVDGGSGDLYAHEGEECGVVVEGRFKGVVADQEYILEAGDSIYYPSSIPHRWENAGDVEAKAVWAITPPSFLTGIISD